MVNNVALLCGIHQIGLADADGLLLYSVVDQVQTVPLNLASLMTD
ncbi:MAG: hypothetical protein U0231_14530 [Nitrospiraceae bacterium]